MPLHLQTPLWLSTPLSRLTGAKVWLKMDALQPSGSFKLRGIGRICETLVTSGVDHLVSSSGGNAGMAVAYAGQQLRVKVTVVVPSTTPPFMVDKIELLGASVLVQGDVWDEADAHARSLAAPDNCGYVSPFNHPEIWAGHSTLIDELAAEMEPPDLIVLAVGGGGLLCGVAEGLHRIGWKRVPVLAVETEGTASFAAAVAAGKPVTLPKITSVASSLGAKRVSFQAFEWTKKHSIHSHTVTDRAALEACRRFLDDHRVLVEPACGAALAALYDMAPPATTAQSVVAIVCGGAVVSFDQLHHWLQAAE